MKINNILCIGAGFVGGPTMAVMADRCPHLRVTVVDSDSAKIERWNSDDLPVYEPGLLEVIKRARGRNLFFEPASTRALAGAELIFVSVHTPTKEYGEGAGMAPDMQFLEKCARDILQHANSGVIVVEKSTVPVRTAEAISHILNTGREGSHFQVLSNPEFLAEGSAVHNLEEPDRVLIGHEPTAEGARAAGLLADIYGQWVAPDRVLLSSMWSSELAKLSSNAMLAQRVSSINAISAICEKTNADIGDISRALGMDHRIGDKFLEAGVGFGGSCFRKDILNLVYLCSSYGLEEVAAFWRSVVELNDYQINRFSRMVLERQFNTIAGKKIAIFGFAFKPGTNDTRDTPALRVCMQLLAEKARLAITDPKALENARRELEGVEGDIQYEPDPYKAAEGSHAIVLLTHWPEFGRLDYRRIYDSMIKPAQFFDGRRQIEPEMLHEIGFDVYTIGRPPLTRRDMN